MIIKLYDWKCESLDVDIGDIGNIARIDVSVISGDEIMTVINKDYSIAVYDSSEDRYDDYYDCSYTIYDITRDINDIEEWINRNERGNKFNIF